MGKTPTKVEIFTELENHTMLSVDDVQQLKAIVEQIYHQAELQKQQRQKALQQELIQGIQQLETLADSINSIAMELQNEMFQFKEVACTVNEVYQFMQGTPNPIAATSQGIPLSIWQVDNVAIPNIIRRSSKFVLTSKKVDLFES
jgi:hypothetical protein